MNLHEDKKLFSDTIRAAAQHLEIKEAFVEKDYWITLLLNRLSESKYSGESVFKGGTSLSKSFGLINRFSEDVDIAIINKENRTGNELKKIIRAVEKNMTAELTEIEVEGVTSKGSRFRKTVHEYESINKKYENNRVIVEINSFANPFPYEARSIGSMVHDFLQQTGKSEIIEKYKLQTFQINVLNKEQTLLEKLVSLVRFSFAEDSVESMKEKIRHFYDLHFLMKDTACASFVNSKDFKKKFDELIIHDKEIFDDPTGWQDKEIDESPLIKDFDNTWNQIRTTYWTELSALAYKEIPSESVVAESFKELMNHVQKVVATDQRS